MNDITGDLAFQSWLSCATGHYGPWPVSVSNGTGYTTITEYTSKTSSDSEQVVSPNEEFSNKTKSSDCPISGGGDQ